MGYLRLFFALSVLVYHVTPNPFGFSFFHSSLAVTGFFVISGFYMSLILQEKYVQKKNHTGYLLPIGYFGFIQPIGLFY